MPTKYRHTSSGAVDTLDGNFNGRAWHCLSARWMSSFDPVLCFSQIRPRAKVVVMDARGSKRAVRLARTLLATGISQAFIVQVCKAVRAFQYPSASLNYEHTTAQAGRLFVCLVIKRFCSVRISTLQGMHASFVGLAVHQSVQEICVFSLFI